MNDLFFFFFQAEDGIRDYKVTGVQTCALPISASPPLCSELQGHRGSEAAASRCEADGDLRRGPPHPPPALGLDFTDAGPEKGADEGADGKASCAVDRQALAPGISTFMPPRDARDEEGSREAESQAACHGAVHGPTLGVRAPSERDPDTGNGLPIHAANPMVLEPHHDPSLIDLDDLTDDRAVERVTEEYPNSVSNRS